MTTIGSIKPKPEIEPDLMSQALYSDLPLCVRYFLLVHRLPGIQSNLIMACVGRPKCFADFQGRRVKLTMASRFDDVGISVDLHKEFGYDERVDLSELSNFSDHP